LPGSIRELQVSLLSSRKNRAAGKIFLVKQIICSILGLLLLSMIAIHANDLSVISDSEAFSYLGQNVKVPGLVFAVLISRLGTAFIVQEGLTLVARS
jgi:hypothetical protein